MDKYFQHIIRYFFHHQVSDETASKVQARLVRGKDDSDNVMHEIWDETEGQQMDEATIENAYQKTADRIFIRRRLLRNLSRLRVAAFWAIPFLFLCGSIYYYTISRQAKGNQDVTFIHKYTAYGERALITLPDSSKVWLNGGSTLIYPSTFVSSERNVSLSGEAFFDVVKDKRPFTVDVNQVKLKVLGTTFNVYCYPDQSQVIATLETGKIQVSIENESKPYILLPDDQIVFDSSTGDVAIQKVSASNLSAWRTGTLIFEDVQFSHAIQQLEHAYNVKFHVLNNKYNGQTIRAEFNSNESIEEIMAVFSMLIPSLAYEINGKDIFIK